MKNDEHTSGHERWARLRFAVVGPLLADPPKQGGLAPALRGLAERTWKHPTTGERVRFAFATIERWYYEAKNESRDPVGVLRRRPRSDAGGHPSFSERLCEALRRQYEEHPGWSYRLHADNLEARVAPRDRSRARTTDHRVSVSSPTLRTPGNGNGKPIG